MKKLSILLLFVILTFQGFSQIKPTTVINLGDMPKHPETRGTSTNDTLESPTLLGGVAVYADYSVLGGYFSGTNALFTECYMKYSLANYAALNSITIDQPAKITEVLVWFGIKKQGSSPGNVYSKAYKVAYNPNCNVNAQQSYDGGNAPDSLIGTSDPVNMANVIGSLSFNLTSFKYSTPAPIKNDSFFVSVLYSTNAGDTVAVASTKTTSTVEFPSSGWVGSTTYGFDDYKHLTGTDLDLAIFPVVFGGTNSVKNISDITFASVMPNPANNEIYVGYEISKAGNVNVTLTDMLGRTVSEIGTKSQSEGTHTERFDVSSLATGTYLYKIETTGGVKTGKIYVSH